ncbi:DNA cytosine methyltransferase [Vibrio kanaloae]|uniref:DNA cytosine methyltransferase n=1 Tax=Vibrio kanaloae TaxID=170673 RepID=UPI001F537990|nr:DNA cytosine methyltransferase [Vibrio kanaloae]
MRSSKVNNKLTHIDFFSGPGGFCTGLKAAGFQTLAAVEKVESCVDTYRANHPEVKVINKDIREVTASDFDFLNGQSIDLITSGMPCETFSTAGSKSRSSYDHRQQLYFETLRLAVLLKPKLILFENVTGILSKKVVKGSDRLIIDDIHDDLAEIGYTHFIDTVLDSTDFGIPQTRKRYFLIATNDEKLQLKVPVSTHENIVTVDEAFSKLPIIGANCQEEHSGYNHNESSPYVDLLRDTKFWKAKNVSNENLTYHKAPNHRENTLERFKLINHGENLKDAFTKHTDEELRDLQERKILPKKWFIQRNMRLTPNKPSKTVTSHCLDELIHPHLDRALTVREVARLQSFPDHYDFFGGPYICPHMYETQDKYEQIGDAVPPILSYNWGRTIIDILGW